MRIAGRFGGAACAMALAIGLATTGAMAQDAPARAGGSASPRDLCAVPKGLLPSDASLRYTRSAWFKGEPLVIVAIGSGSTAGAGSGGEGAAYPHHLREALHAQFPDREIKIVNQGHSGESARTMVARFAKEVLPLKPSLVVWQTGTVDAVRSLNVDHFAEALQQGIAMLDAAHTDVILVNPQYAARIELMIHFDPYLSAMEFAAGQTDATLFDRFRIMRHWVAKGTIDLSTGNRDARREKAEEAQACIGTLLADVVIRSIR
jgi:lysophospholipase L1-like esterase